MLWALQNPPAVTANNMNVYGTAFSTRGNSVQIQSSEPRRRRRGGGSRQFESGPCYLRQHIIAVCCLFHGLHEMNQCHQSHPGKPGNHSTNEQLCAPRSCWSLMSAQAVIAGFLCVYKGSHRRKIFPRLGNSRLSHVNCLTSNRSFAHSAAFPQTQHSQALSPHPISPVIHSRSLALLIYCQSLLRQRTVKSERQTQKVKPHRSRSLH